MRKAFSIPTSTPTEVFAASKERDILIVQNVSDTDMSYDLTAEGTSALTLANGLVLAAGEILSLTHPFSGLSVTLYHEAGSNKSVRLQSTAIKGVR